MDNRQKTIIIVLVIALICIAAIIGVLLISMLRGQEAPTEAPPPTAAATIAATATPMPTSAPPAASDPVWDRIQAAGKIAVGISADYPPFAFVADDFSIQGYDLALIREIGKRLNLPMDVQNQAFDGLGDSLMLGQIDMAVAAISVTNERDQYVDFTNVYYVSEDAVLARQDSPITIGGWQDLAAYRLGVQRASVYENWVLTTLVEPGLMKPQYLVTFQTPEEALQALAGSSQTVDLVLMDYLPAEVAMRQAAVKIVSRNLVPQRYAIAIPQGASAFQAQLNDALAQMQADGTLAALAKQYLNVENLPPLPTPAPTAAPLPPPACLDGMEFVQDLNYPDNNMTTPAQFPPGTPFQKGWRIRNVGTCTWDSTYRLVYTGSNPPNSSVGGNPVAIQGNVAPGQTFDIFVSLVAPIWPGRYQSFWSMQNPAGLLFGQRIWAGFEVIAPAGPTATPIPQAPVIYNFSADRSQIQQGQCVTISWLFSAQNLTMSRIFRNNQVILQDMAFSGSIRDCPPGTGRMEYRLVIDTQSAGSAQASGVINVVPAVQPTVPPPPTAPVQPTATSQPTPEPPPVITSFTADSDEIAIGQCVTLSWSYSGTSLAATAILRNGEQIGNNPPPSGSLQDCPPEAGLIEYTLLVSSEFAGTAQQSIYVNVIGPTPR